MADTVSSVRAYGGNASNESIFRYTNRSDGTGESAVAKIDVSGITLSDGSTATKIKINRIEYNVNGFDYVHVYWDHTADVTIAVLAGQGMRDFSYFGGFSDSGSGGTGDVMFTTAGGASGSSYDITIYYEAL